MPRRHLPEALEAAAEALAGRPARPLTNFGRGAAGHCNKEIDHMKAKLFKPHVSLDPLSSGGSVHMFVGDPITVEGVPMVKRQFLDDIVPAAGYFATEREALCAAAAEMEAAAARLCDRAAAIRKQAEEAAETEC